jgi:hypothetical protein
MKFRIRVSPASGFNALLQLGIIMKFLLFQIVDTVKSFLDRVEEIGKTGYLPSQSVFLKI